MNHGKSGQDTLHILLLSIFLSLPFSFLNDYLKCKPPPPPKKEQKKEQGLRQRLEYKTRSQSQGDECEEYKENNGYSKQAGRLV